MRKINAKVFLGLLLSAIICTGAVFGIHHFQYGRIADSLLWQARRAEEQGQIKRQARYLQRYLEFNGRDLEAKAQLARLWAGDVFADSLRDRKRAMRLLDEVLDKGEDNPELRRLLVKVALELRQWKIARTHLEKLLTRDFLNSPPKPEDVEPKAEPGRGEAEGYAGRLLEVEKEPAKALRCFYLAVRHAPEVQDNYLALARLKREGDKDDAKQARENDEEADRIIDELVKNNHLSPEAYLARWSYRRKFNLIDLRDAVPKGEKQQTTTKVKLKTAAGDVAEALQRAPESVSALLAAADLERLEAQAILAGQGEDDVKEKGRKEHRDKALTYLNQALKLHAKGGRQATTDQTQFRLLWHKANLLLDDIEQFDLAHPGDESAKNNEQRQAWIADVTLATEQIRKTRGAPAAAEYLKGRLLLQDQRWAEAVTLFEQVRPTLGTQPDLAGQINRYLGQCYERLVQPNQMYSAYERLLRTEPGSIAAQLGMAQAEGAMGHLDGAAAIFQKLAQAKQLPNKVWLDYARLEIQRQAQRPNPNWDYVEKLLANARIANPQAVDVQLLRAQMWMVRRPEPGKTPDIRQARKVLEDAQADKQWKDNAELWAARIYLELRNSQSKGNNQSEEAKRILDEAKKALGERVVLLRLAEANLLAAKPDEKGVEEAITRLGGDADSFSKEEERASLLSGLADIQMNLKNTAAARDLLQRVAKLPSRKNDLTLKMMLFDLAVKLEDETGQRQALDDIRAVEGDRGLFHRYGEALRLISLAKNESTPEGERRKFLTDAGAHLDRVHSMRSTWPPLYLARAEVARLTGQNEEIIRNLEQAVQYGETSPAVIGELAQRLDNIGRYDDASRWLKRVREPLLANSDLKWLVGQVAAHRNDTQTMERLLQMSRTAEGSTDYRSLLYEGRMAAELNKPEAEEKLKKALALAKKEPAPYLALVQFYAKQQRQKDADVILEQARQNLPAEQVKLTLAQCDEILGRKKAAQAGYEAMLNGHRQDAAIVRRVAGFYWNSNELIKAEPLLRDIVAKRVKDPSTEDVNWARWHLALLLASGTDYGRFREAIQLVGLKLDGNGQLIRDPERERTDSTDTRRFQARVLAAQAGHRQFRQRARELLEELERGKSLLPDDRFVLAMLYETENNGWTKAKPILMELVKPKDPAPRHLAYYVQMLLEHKELKEAAKEVEHLEALELERGSEPNAFAAIELRARLLEEDKSGAGGEKALKLLEDHIRRDKAKPDEVLLVLNSMRRQKKFAVAFERCLKTWDEKKCKPETIGGASVAMLRSMQSAGSPATREQVLLIEEKLKDALHDDPKNVALMLHLAELYDQRGDWQGAEQMYRQVLLAENEPKNIVALNNLAWLLAQHASESDKLQEALTRIETAVNGIGRRADLIDTRGLVYMRLNQDTAALADFRDAVADMPTPAHLFHLARAHYKAQDKTNAVKVLKEAEKNGLQANVLHPVEQKDYQKLLEELKIR